MRVNISAKNYHPSDHLKEMIDKKFSKLDKYFPEEAVTEIMVEKGKAGYKFEAMLQEKGTLFRSEVTAEDPYIALDIAVGKLSRQMSKFKSKLKAKFKPHKDMRFDILPTDNKGKIF